MNEERVKNLLSALGFEQFDALADENETDLSELAAGLTSSWKKAGQADENHHKELKSKLYGELHGAYKTGIKKALGLTDAEVKDLDKAGLEALIADRYREAASSHPDKEKVQELQRLLAETTEARDGLQSSLEKALQEIQELEPKIEKKINERNKIKDLFVSAFSNIEGFNLSHSEAIAAFKADTLAKSIDLNQYKIETDGEVLRAVNAETGELLYNDNKPVNVSDMAKNWALSKAAKQKPQTPKEETGQKATGGNLKNLAPEARKLAEEQGWI